MVFPLNWRQLGKQTAEEIKEKKDGNNGGKELRTFFFFFDRGGEANELNIVAITIHAKQTKTQKKNMQIPA